MPLIDVCYVKGRSGATTAAGGDLTLRHGLKSSSPGLVELATATRTGGHGSGAAIGDADGGDTLSRFAQPIRIGDRTVEVVVAPSGGAQTRVALSVLARPGHGALIPVDRTVVADCGRLDFSSPTWPLLRSEERRVGTE